MEPLPSTASENKFEFLRQLSMVSRKLKQTCFALYRTESKKFVDNTQPCFAGYCQQIFKI